MPSEPAPRAVIMAGGRGRRMIPYTAVLPKPLLPVHPEEDMPILEVQLRQLARQGFRRVTICVGYKAELIVAYFGDGARLGLELDYSRETEPLGTIGPLRLVPELDGPFLLMNGDVLTDMDFAALHAWHAEHGALVSVATRRQQVSIPLGVLEFDDEQRIESFREKPSLDYWACVGIYAMSPEVLAHVPPGRPFGFDELAATLLAEGLAPRAWPFEGLWLDLAHPSAFEEAGALLRAHRSALIPE